MNIDERLDRLTERHEALTQYLELTSHEWDRRFSELTKATNDSGRKIEELGRIVRQSAASIDALGRIAEMHAQRLNGVEGA